MNLKSPLVWIIGIVLLITIACIAGVAALGGNIFQSGGPLTVTQAAPFPTTVALEVLPTATPGPLPTEAPVPTQAPLGLCGQTGQVQVLVIVFASRGEEPFGAESIQIIQFDYASNRIRSVAIDRELIVPTPNQSGYPGNSASLNNLYYFRIQQNGGFGQASAQTAGANLLAQAIYDNLGLLPQHYVTFDASIVPGLIDSIGGLEIDVPKAYRYGDFSVPAGQQKWNGRTTLRYLSSLDNNEPEWQRRERQILVLRSLLFSPSFLVRLPDLAPTITSSLTTDLDAGQTSALTCLAVQINPADVQVTGVDKDLSVRPPDGSILNLTSTGLKAYLQSWQAGQ